MHFSRASLAVRLNSRLPARTGPQGCQHLQRAQSAQRGWSALRLLLQLAVVAALLVAAAWWWSQRAFSLPVGMPVVDVTIPAGTSVNGAAHNVVKAGVDTSPSLLYWYWRIALLGTKTGVLKAGAYEVVQGDSPRSLLVKISEGRQSLRSVTLVEGWNIRQVRAALAKAEHLKPTTQAMNDAQLMAAVGKPGVHPEGRFFAETYSYAKGSSDVAVLKLATNAMDKQLQAVWEARAPNLPLQSAADALILASIIEKETGSPADRAVIGGVFTNRLRIGMRLQTDPTVIYGLGEAFDGDIRKRDLLTDTPYNTYTRAGLPPTPIAMPGKAALMAAVQPASTPALYFVARGDGTSQFSATLDAHNQAVNKYIRGKP